MGANSHGHRDASITDQVIPMDYVHIISSSHYSYNKHTCTTPDPRANLAQVCDRLPQVLEDVGQVRTTNGYIRATPLY